MQSFSLHYLIANAASRQISRQNQNRSVHNAVHEYFVYEIKNFTKHMKTIEMYNGVFNFNLTGNYTSDFAVTISSQTSVSAKMKCIHNTSINQSIEQTNRRLQVIQSTNQSIPYYWFSIIRTTKQSSKQSINSSVPWHSECTQSINQLSTISKSVFSLNCRSLLAPIVFCTVLGW